MMKRVFTIILLVLLPCMVMAQSASVRHMLRKCDPGKEVTRIYLPAFVIRMASWMVDDQDARAILKNVRSLYIMVSEDRDFSESSDIPTVVADKLKNGKFEELMNVRENGQSIIILLRENKRNIREMVITVDGDEDMVLYLKGRLDIREMIGSQDIISGITL